MTSQNKSETFVMTGETIIKTSSILHNKKIIASDTKSNSNPASVCDKIKEDEVVLENIDNAKYVFTPKILHSPNKSVASYTKQSNDYLTNNCKETSEVETNEANEINSKLDVPIHQTPRRKIELEIPPDDISAEDEEYKEVLAHTDDLPPPPEHFFHQSNSSDGFCTFTSIQNNTQQQTYKLSKINNLTNISENITNTSYKSSSNPKITLFDKYCSKETLKDLLNRSLECEDLKSPERYMQDSGSQSRVYRSHENYLQMLHPIDLSPLFLEEPGAVSVDALNYEKIESSLNNVEAFLNSNDLCDIIDFNKRNSNIHPNLASQPAFTSQSTNNSQQTTNQQPLLHSTSNGNAQNLCYNNNLDKPQALLTLNSPAYTPNLSATNNLSHKEQICPIKARHSSNSTALQPQSPLKIATTPPSAYHDIPLSSPSPSIDLANVHCDPIVDASCAQRLADRLFHLEGFITSDVSKHLNKNDAFSLMVGQQYLKHFSFQNLNLDFSLRKFLGTVGLEGETQEKERVVSHFSHRFIQCNDYLGLSEDSCHTLVCALLLLNSDHHNQSVHQKMSLDEFINNLEGLSDQSTDYPSPLLTALYLSITTKALPCPSDVHKSSLTSLNKLHLSDNGSVNAPELSLHSNPFLTVPDPQNAKEYKRGYVMKKNCASAGGLRTSLGKRGWQISFVVLRDMILYLYKDENDAKKATKHGFQGGLEQGHKCIRVHHALSRPADDYQKKPFVFRLNVCDQSEYLFQTSDLSECQSWINNLNMVSACLSGAPLPSGVGSEKKKFQRPLMPSSYTKFNLREQYDSNMQVIDGLEEVLSAHRVEAPKGGRMALVYEFRQEEGFLELEIERFNVYCKILKDKMNGVIN